VSLLVLRAVSVRFNGLTVLENLDLSFGEQPMNVLIGPNGAGKTTVLNVLSGAVKPVAGTVRLDGEDLTGAAPLHFAREGIVRKFQVPTVFAGLTVAENLRVASSAPRPRRYGSAASRADRVRDLAAILRLDHRIGDLAADLSHGERQWLEMGMAFVSEPRFLLLDEPAAGLGPGETQHTADLIRLMSEQCCVIAVEHDMEFVRALGGEVTVLHHGDVLARGEYAEIESDDRVRDVYLGRGA
jgi:ABC-type uncharacterized transport system ATPase subunit